MGTPVDLGEAPPQSLFDGALGLSLATGVPLRLHGPIAGADASLVLAAVKLGADGPAPVEAVRAQLAREGPHDLLLPRPRAGLHLLELREPGAVARALWTFSWPLALLGKPSELRLSGPNHCDGSPTFHELRLSWAPLAARFGLKVALELPLAGFGSEPGELSAALDPAPALTPLQLVHRGLLRQVSIVAATAGNSREPAEAAQQAVRELRAHGIIAEAERVPLPQQGGSSARRWALTAVAEFEHSLVSFSALGPDRDGPLLLRDGEVLEAPPAGERVAERLAHFLACRGALDARTAERLLLPALLCAAGLGARAGTPPSCHFTTSEVTAGMVSLATLARRMLPVRAVVDGAVGEEGMVVAAPA